MRYLSVCSGIEAATVAWHSLGWQPVAFSEIEKFPSAVLAHHYPSVPNWGDMTRFQEWPDANVDVLVGGTPCQSFSVAGLRKGLADPRGNLMLTFGAIAQRHRPRWLVWENVPGVLSSNGGRDFGTFLGMLGELGYGFAFRILDSQYVRTHEHPRAVPQRRRRVFVVGYLGDWHRAAAVLFERHSLSGHPAPSRQTRKGTAAGAADGVDANGIQHTVGTLCADTHPDAYSGQDAYTGRLVPQPIDFRNLRYHEGDVSGTMQSKNTGGYSLNYETGVLQPIAIQGNLVGRTEGGPQGVGASEDGVMYTLTKADVHAVAQPIPYDLFQVTAPVNRQNRSPGDPCHTLARDNAPHAAIVYERHDQDARVKEVTVSPTLHSKSDNTCDLPMVQTAMQVRRLTPKECSRLQGFPDTYLELTYGTESEAHAAQVLHELWRQVGTYAREGWRPGVVASLLTPQILLAGVYGGWVSWQVASSCASASRALSGQVGYEERFLLRLQEAGKDGRSPYQRESFRQLAAELGCSVSQLPLEETQAREVLQRSELWQEAQRTWPLRYAFATETQKRSGKLNPDGPRYKALGNSMAVPCMAWIGKRIQQVEEI